MTRIALVSPHTLPFYCGNSTMAERLRKGLTSRGYDVSLFNAGENTFAEAAAFAPHILHSLNADKSYQWARTVIARLRIPWIITLTGTDYNTWCGIKDPPAHIRESLEHAAALVAFHPAAFDALIKCMPSVAPKIQTIPQGVDSASSSIDVSMVREKNGIGLDEVVFLMVGGIRPVKNLGAALAAFRVVEKQAPRIRLLIIGPIIDKHEAEQILAFGRKIKCFTYLGERPPSEVRNIMRAADIFLNTSLNEGMPGSVLEAMAEGLPILASSVTGNQSLVREGENGLLFPLENREALISAAVRLAADASLRRRFGEAGKQIVAADYSVEKEIDNYHRLYNGLLQK
ncbi:MAG: glycosyltransferase [Proteobacteria bacterium]|nr:glycosyltransferase [Pseudomonadota bacterium]